VLYRQIAHKLRIQRRAPETSERPRDTASGHFLDEPCANQLHRHPQDLPPTLLELGADDPVDLAGLLRLGAITPYVPPKTVKAKEERHGEGL